MMSINNIKVIYIAKNVQSVLYHPHFVPSKVHVLHCFRHKRIKYLCAFYNFISNIFCFKNDLKLKNTGPVWAFKVTICLVLSSSLSFLVNSCFLMIPSSYSDILKVAKNLFEMILSKSHDKYIYMAYLLLLDILLI